MNSRRVNIKLSSATERAEVKTALHSVLITTGDLQRKRKEKFLELSTG